MLRVVRTNAAGRAGECYAPQRTDDGAPSGVREILRMHNYRKLDVYHRARTFARNVYLLTAAVTKPEERNITSQLRRSALSISATISEGFGKLSRAETLCYFDMSRASTAESEHHLGLGAELLILPEQRCNALIDEAAQIQRMLRRLIENFPQ
jgi:four helix bundle protein